MSLMEFSAVQLAGKIKKKECTCREAVKEAFRQIEEKEAKFHCYISLDKERALKRAEQVQAAIDAGELAGPLAGVPIAVKDNICTKDVKTTCASRILSNFVPSYSAEAVVRLERAGAIILGKTNMDEFAMGSTTETSAFGVTGNPWNPGHVPGGSSGGSAAAVAAGECFAALGSDTGGSIRQPAGFCGVVGMKPTYGAVSRYGLVAYGSSLDQIGPLCRDVADCAAILEVIAGHDQELFHLRGFCCRRGKNGFYLRAETVSGMRIGIPRDYFPSEGCIRSTERRRPWRQQTLKDKGAEVEEFDLPLVEYAIPAYYTIASAEASSNLERFDGIKYGYRASEYEGLHQMYKRTRSEGFGPEVKRRIMLGSFVLSSGYYDAYYLKALRVKALIKKAFDEAFARYDCLLGPVAPTTAPGLGESLTDPIRMYLGDIYTISANLAGLPGICLPCGLDSRGLPIGLQLVGDCFQEKKLIQAAFSYEQARGRFPDCPGRAEETAVPEPAVPEPAVPEPAAAGSKAGGTDSDERRRG